VLDFEEIRQYWQDRATSDSSAQSTTRDVYLREIEFTVLKDLISKKNPLRVADVGCGDGRTTLRLALEYPAVTFYGGDYSDAMIENAKRVICASGANNISVGLCDITNGIDVPNVDMIYTTRCLINLPSWELQCKALDHIHAVLPKGGHYVMIENFVEGQTNFNTLRKAYGLPSIAIRKHNLFFERPILDRYLSGKFEVVEEANISSSYYLATRIIYTKICHERNLDPDYFDEHHRYAVGLPFLGEFGPVRMLSLRKQ
jgi:ubiquinone/menaquinone biosynthesis C-methylase UbiE